MSNIVVTPEDWNSITPSTPAVAALHTDRTCAADAGGGVGVRLTGGVESGGGGGESAEW